MDCPELTNIIDTNYEYWKEKLTEEQQTGVRLTFKSGSTLSVATISGGTSGLVERPGRLHTVQEQGSDDLQSPSISEVLSDPLKSLMTTPNSEDVEASVPLINDAHDKSDTSPTELAATTLDLSTPPSVVAAVVLVGGGTADSES